MKTILSLFALMALAAAGSFAADETWTGKISDSMCGASHKSAAMHAGKNMTDRECAQECVKNGGKYVFVKGGKVYNIANQDYAGLEQHAGESVKLTGSMNGDTVTVTNIEAAGGHKKAEKSS